MLVHDDRETESNLVRTGVLSIAVDESETQIPEVTLMYRH